MDGNVDSHAEDWGPFGRPLFEDPQARALSRVGVVDVGSNSVRMVVFDGAAHECPVYWRDHLPRDAVIEGPAVIEQMDTTTLIDPGTTARRDALGNLLLEVRP